MDEDILYKTRLSSIESQPKKGIVVVEVTIIVGVIFGVHSNT